MAANIDFSPSQDGGQIKTVNFGKENNENFISIVDLSSWALTERKLMILLYIYLPTLCKSGNIYSMRWYDSPTSTNEL